LTLDQAKTGHIASSDFQSLFGIPRVIRGALVSLKSARPGNCRTPATGYHIRVAGCAFSSFPALA
jgi:hypothetical protein